MAPFSMLSQGVLMLNLVESPFFHGKNPHSPILTAELGRTYYDILKQMEDAFQGGWLEKAVFWLHIYVMIMFW